MIAYVALVGTGIYGRLAAVKSMRPFKFSLRSLFLTTTVLALALALWKLAIRVDPGLSLHAIFCEAGAFVGLALTTSKVHKEKPVLRGALAGSTGGSLSLLTFMLTIDGGWRLFFLSNTIGVDAWDLAYFLLFWGIAGAVYGGVIGFFTGLLITILLGERSNRVLPNRSVDGVLLEMPAESLNSGVRGAEVQARPKSP